MRVSAIVPVMNETDALLQTIDVLVRENAARLHEIWVVVCERTTPEARAAAAGLVARYPKLMRIRAQQRPFLGGAIRDAFGWCTGTHVLMMAADLETDPHVVKDLIAKAEGGYDIVTATRWAQGGSFAPGYDKRKLWLNWAFQKMCSGLYGTHLTDVTYGFRLFRAEWVKNIDWQQSKHPFLLETMLKPLRLGAQVVEVPCTWRARDAGESQNSFMQTFAYVPVALKTRFTPRSSLRAKERS